MQVHYIYFTSERKCATVVVVVAGGNLKAVFDPLIFVFHSSLSKGFCFVLFSKNRSIIFIVATLLLSYINLVYGSLLVHFSSCSFNPLWWRFEMRDLCIKRRCFINNYVTFFFFWEFQPSIFVLCWSRFDINFPV